MKLHKLGVLAVGVTLAATACTTGTPAGSGAGVAVKIGIELPLTGGEKPNGDPTLKGVQLALSQITVPGYTITLNVQDDAVNGVHDAQQGAKNAQTLVNDPSVIGVIGPYNSSVAKAEIPITNAATLTQCSPANTAIELTKPEFGSADLRKSNPTKNNYVRVAATDDIQGAAGADIAFNTVHAKKAFVIDDTQVYGKALSAQFMTTFKKLGGTVVDDSSHGVPKSQATDFTSLITQAKAASPDYVFFGGVTTSGIGLFRKQMITQGFNVPMGGGDGINDGSAATSGSFLNLAGDAGDQNTFSTVAAIHDIPNPDKFKADYKAMFSTDPGSYSAPAYACAQIILEALKNVGNDREKIRAYVTDSTHKYNTVLGNLSFDANGDTSQHVISYYQYDATTKDWKFTQQRDFTANPL